MPLFFNRYPLVLWNVLLTDQRQNGIIKDKEMHNNRTEGHSA